MRASRFGRRRIGFTVVRDLAGEALRVEAVLGDGRRVVLYPLTPEQREAMEEFLEQPKPAAH